MSGQSKFGVSGANLEWVEQIWCGWSKFGVGGANLEWVEQIWSGWSRCGHHHVFSNKTGFSITVHVKSAATTKKKELSLNGALYITVALYMLKLRH